MHVTCTPREITKRGRFLTRVAYNWLIPIQIEFPITIIPSQSFRPLRCGRNLTPRRTHRSGKSLATLALVGWCVDIWKVKPIQCIHDEAKQKLGIRCTWDRKYACWGWERWVSVFWMPNKTAIRPFQMRRSCLFWTGEWEDVLCIQSMRYALRQVHIFASHDKMPRTSDAARIGMWPLHGTSNRVKLN